MYESFYGLSGRPFQLTPDPEFYFESLTHRKALSYLGYGLAQGEGFIVITGDVGAGKTTLVAHLMATIDKARLTAANIVTTRLDSEDIVGVSARHFGIDTANMDKAQLLSAFEELLHSEARAGRRCLLIVDEAQNLPTGALEELRMLSNFQLGGQALLQIFLLGQPEFRDMLQESPALEQLRQRVIAHHHLEPMGAEEIEPYITHRLSKAGWSGRPKIARDVFTLLHTETQGVPRKLNTLMSRILLMGSVEQAEVIDQSLVGRVLADMDGEEVEITRPAAPQAGSEPAGQSASPVAAEMGGKTELKQPMEAVSAQPKSPEVVPLKAFAADQEPSTTAPNGAAASPPAANANPAAASPSAKTPDKGVAARVDIVSKRLTMLETRMNGQEENLHRILTMLVEWVESDIRKKEAFGNAGRAA